MGYVANAMTTRSIVHSGAVRISCLVASCAALTVACGAQAVRSGASVGSVGSGLALHAQAAPQGAQICLWQDSLGPQPPQSADKAVTETCGSALKSDLMWRRAVLVMSLYGQRVGSVAAGVDPDSTGKLEAALSGVRDANWSDVNDQGARDAVTTLVSQMYGGPNKTDLGKIVQDASAPVKTICDGLLSYLDAQSQSLNALQKEVDKKRMSRTAHRCGMLEKQTICVNESVVDRMTYANLFGQIFALENSTQEGRDSVARFCVAHEKLAAAAADGKLAQKQTYFDIVDAVKAVERPQATWSTTGTPVSMDTAKAAEAPKAAEPPKAAEAEAPKPAEAPKATAAPKYGGAAPKK